ncbi:MAG: hypothetical protein AAF489_16605, partial [Bacteroidota bacterium]
KIILASIINQQEENLYDNFRKKNKVLNRLNTYQNDKNKFLNTYVFSYISEENYAIRNDDTILQIPYLHLYNKEFFYPEYGNSDFKIPEEYRVEHSKIIEACKLFSESFICTLQKKQLSPSKLMKESKFKLDSIFDRPDISKLLNEKWVRRLVRLMTNPNDQQIKEHFLYYIIEGDSHGFPDGTSGGYIKNSFLKSYKTDIDIITEGQFYNSFLGSKNIKEFRGFLENDLTKAFEKLKNFKSIEKKMSTSIIGVKLEFNYIFLLSGLVLFFFNTLFYLYRNIESDKISEGIIQEQFLFPSFSIKGSPFSNPISKTDSNSILNYYFTNTTWLIFLLLPIIILFIGYIFRYDLSNAFSREINADNLMYDKSSDIISFFADLVNLIALLYSVWIVIRLTPFIENPGSFNKFNFNWHHMLFLIILFAILSYFNILPSYHYYSSYYGLDIIAILANFIYLIQILSWFYFVYFSIKNYSLLGGIISIIAIIINLDLLFG